MLLCDQREIIASVQQMIDSDVEASRHVSLTLNSSLTLIESNLVAQETVVNRTLSTLVDDFTAFSDTVRDRLSRTPDVLAAANLPQSPRSRLAASLDDLRRLGAEFRLELTSFGVEERSAWKRLVADELTRPFYRTIRGDVASFSMRQLMEFAEHSPGGDSAGAPGEWSTNYEFDRDSPSGAGSRLSSMDVRYALLNADVPSMDLSTISDRVTRELSSYADLVDVDRTLKVKVEDLLTKFDELTSSVESLMVECRPLSDDDAQRLIR